MSDKGDPICFCFEVYKDEIVSIVKQYKTRTVEDLQKYCKASMGCGSCRAEVESIIAEELAKLKK